MAITKIHPIKHTLGKSITYIGNECKTEGGKYIYTFGCAYETAELEFELTAQSARDGGENKAYHLIQSFKPNEVTAEQCHAIGKKFADEVLGGKYEYVLCTHTDKGHYHNHIIFNAVSFQDHKRYRSDKKSYYRIQEISDKICAEYGLNVVEPSGRKRSYEQKKTYISNKYKIKKAIDECILFAVDYEDFLRRMRDKKYIVREDEFLWFRDTVNKRFTKTDTIGRGYEKDNIELRIKGMYQPKTVDLLIDVEHNVKCQQSKGYEQWAKIHNLQLIAKTLIVIHERGIADYDDLAKRVSDKSKKLKETADKIKSDKKRITELDALIKKLNMYRNLKPIYEEYTKKNPLLKNSFYSNHKQEIDLFRRLTNELKPHLTENNKLPSMKQIESEKQRLLADISRLSALHKDIKEEYDDIAVLKKNVDMFLDIKPEQETPKKKPSILKKLTEYRERADRETEQTQHHNGHNDPEL